MKLLAPRIIQALPPLQSTAHIPLIDKTIICKFYMSGGWRLSWYVFEGEPDTQGIYRFFGVLVKENLAASEVFMGYFYLSDLIALIDIGYDIQLDKTVFKASYVDTLKEPIKKAWPLCQNFLVEKLIRALPPLGSTTHIPVKDKKMICRFCLEDKWRWDVFEGELDYGMGYRFFGRVKGDEKECGYFHISELLEIEKHYGRVISVDHP